MNKERCFYIKKRNLFKILSLFLFFTFISVINVNAETGGIPSSEFLPKGEQYLNPDNIATYFDTGFHLSYIYETERPFRVKENTKYNFKVREGFYSENYEVKLSFYDINKELLSEITDSIHKGEFFSSLGYFITPQNTHYISIFFLAGRPDEPLMTELPDDYFDNPLYFLSFSENDIGFETEYEGPYVDLSPVITGETAFITNVDDPMDIQDIMSHIKAIDAEDGDITHLIVIENDNYSTNKNTLGTYDINLSVTDSSNNRTEISVYVLVKDVVGPIFSGPSKITSSITKLKNVEEIKALLSVTDNYDDSSLLTIKVESNDYQSNYNKVGEWPITFSSTDTSGNTTTYIVLVQVIDDVFPVISGPKTIMKGQTETLTLNQIKAELSANDNVDGDITDKIIVESDNYTGKGHLVGTYSIVFSVKDNAGNETTHEVKITVKDNVPPVFFVDNFFINVSQSLTLTNEDIKNILIATGQLNPVGVTKLDFVLNEYAGNEENIGIYAVQINTTSTSGSEEVINLAVKVNEAENPGDIIIEEPSVFQKIFDHIIEYYYYYLPALIILLFIAFANTNKRKRW